MKKTIVIVFTGLAALTAGLYLWMRQPVSPAARFEKILNTPVSLACTQAILAAYEKKLAIRESKAKKMIEHANNARILEKLAVDNRDNVFYDEEIHKKIGEEIRRVSNPKDVNTIKALTTHFRDILANKNKAFYMTCENIQLRFFNSCFRQFRGVDEVTECTISALKSSEDLRALISRL